MGDDDARQRLYVLVQDIARRNRDWTWQRMVREAQAFEAQRTIAQMWQRMGFR